MGSLTTLLAATSPDVIGNDDYGPNGPFGTEFSGYPKICETSTHAQDKAFATALWKK